MFLLVKSLSIFWHNAKFSIRCSKNLVFRMYITLEIRRIVLDTVVSLLLCTHQLLLSSMFKLHCFSNIYHRNIVAICDLALFVLFCFGCTGVWTQDLVLSQQACYHMNHTPGSVSLSSFVLCCAIYRVSVFHRPNNTIIYFSMQLLYE